MSLDSPEKYLPTLDLSLAHWSEVESVMGVPLILPEGGRAVGLALRGELEEAVDGVREAVVDLEILRGEMHLLRAAARGGLERFLAVVRAYWADTPWEDLVGRLPQEGAALDKFLRPCRDGVRLWELLETEPPAPGAPVPIRIGAEGEMGRAEYAAVVEALRLKGLAVEAAEFSLAARRARRNAVMRRVKVLLTSYQRVLRARLPEEDPLVISLPRLWPLPGHTPDAVRAAGGWIPERSVARLTWTGSKDAALECYQVRGCPGAEYRKEDETVVGTISPEAERVLETGALLERPGAVACFRVYVVLKTGNERASNGVAVERV